jgi:hypothetical protein
LVRGVYNCRHVGSVRFNNILVPTSKFLCFFLPLLSVAFPFAPFFDKRLSAALIISCAPSKSRPISPNKVSQSSSTCTLANAIVSVRRLGSRWYLHHRHPNQIRPRPCQFRQDRGFEVCKHLTADPDYARRRQGQDESCHLSDRQVAAVAV